MFYHFMQDITPEHCSIVIQKVLTNYIMNTHDWNNDKPYECGLETLDGG